MINLIYIVIIVIVLFLILNIMKLYLNSENFESGEIFDVFNNIDDVQLTELKKKSALINSLDKTATNIKSGKKDKKSISEDLLDEYIENLILNDRETTNKIFENDDKEDLPYLDNNNDLSKYNTKIRMLINSKKIKQDYIIMVLTNNIKKILNSLEKVENLQKKNN